MTELTRRGITFGERRPLIAVGSAGSKNTLWTNVTLRPFSDSDGPADAMMHIFLSEYSPAYVNVEERRARLRRQLAASGGGPLGVVEVKEVIIGAIDVASASLDRATKFLRNNKLLGADPEGRPTIDLSTLGDLDFRLVDK